MAIGQLISKSQAQESSGRLSNFYMVEYCEIFKIAFSKILGFSAQAQNSLYSSHKILATIEKVKTAIGCYFLLPDL